MKTVSVIGKYSPGRTLKQVLLTVFLLLTALFCDGKALTVPAADHGFLADVAAQMPESTLAVPDDSSDNQDDFLSDFVVLPLAMTVPELPVRRLPGNERNGNSHHSPRFTERVFLCVGKTDESFCHFCVNVISRMFARSCDYYVFWHNRLLN